ncbi:MAG: AAA domain-containing protein [Candidatus Latescibacterota bacterium]
MYLPKPANEEQYRVLELAQRRPGVTAQGPPGTGKSHTIADLICHFVAHGKRVLVTAEKEQALSVLTGKLPPAVRQLTVSVLGTDQAARTRLEHALNAIQSSVSAFDRRHVEDEIRRLEAEIGAIDAETARATNQLRQARASEATRLQGTHEAGTDPSPSQVGEWLRRRSELAIIPDELEMPGQMPLSESEWDDLVALLRRLLPADIAACEQVRPQPQLLPSGPQLARLAEEREELRATLADADYAVSDWASVDATTPEELLAVAGAVEDARDWLRAVSGTWLETVRREATVPLTRAEWQEFLDGLTASQQAAVTYRRATAGSEIVLPELPEEVLESCLREAHHRFADGKGLPRLGKRGMVRALQACSVDRTSPRTATQVELCLAALSRRQHQRRLRVRWLQGIERVNGPALPEGRPPEDAVAEHLGGLGSALAWSSTTWPQLAARLAALGLVVPHDPSIDEVARLAEILPVLRQRRRERELTRQLSDLQAYLGSGAGTSPSGSVCATPSVGTVGSTGMMPAQRRLGCSRSNVTLSGAGRWPRPCAL